MISMVHNMMMANAQRQTNLVTGKKNKSAEKLSSGYKINRASDDAAGLSISEKMRRQVRGLTKAVENCQDGISLVQVADGALNESQDILQRLNQLAIQSANGTNSEQDRQAIDAERRELVVELNRIATTTTFNEEIYPLCGEDAYLVQPTKMVSYGDVNFDDDVILGPLPGSGSINGTNTEVGWRPFLNQNDYDSLRLEAVIKDDNHYFSQDTYSLIYSNGGTSFSRIRLTGISVPSEGSVVASPPVVHDIAMSEFTFVSSTSDPDNAKWTRTFEWKSNEADSPSFGVQLVQTIEIDSTRKDYVITNQLKNIGNKEFYYEFMLNMDTAYNNNDSCEGYYMNGSELQKFSIYTTKDPAGTDPADNPNSFFLQNTLNWHMPLAPTDENGDPNPINSSIYESTDYPGSVSIVNRDFSDALPFTEKITLDPDRKPVISVGRYRSETAGDASHRWDYFEGAAPNRYLGSDCTSADRTTTLIWSSAVGTPLRTGETAGATDSFTYRHGVDNVMTDTNLPPGTNDILHFREIAVPDWDKPPYLVHGEHPSTLRIQAGVDPLYGNRIYIQMVDARTKALGVDDVDLSTQESSEAAINKIKNALRITSEYRSYFGAVQNRMEHTINNLKNIQENTQEAESHIRDTDVATEMVEYSNLNILQQAGTSMMTNAQRDRQSILSLIQ